MDTRCTRCFNFMSPPPAPPAYKRRVMFPRAGAHRPRRGVSANTYTSRTAVSLAGSSSSGRKSRGAAGAGAGAGAGSASGGDRSDGGDGERGSGAAGSASLSFADAGTAAAGEAAEAADGGPQRMGSPLLPGGVRVGPTTTRYPIASSGGHASTAGTAAGAAAAAAGGGEEEEGDAMLRPSIVLAKNPNRDGRLWPARLCDRDEVEESFAHSDLSAEAQVCFVGIGNTLCFCYPLVPPFVKDSFFHSICTTVDLAPSDLASTSSNRVVHVYLLGAFKSLGC